MSNLSDESTASNSSCTRCICALCLPRRPYWRRASHRILWVGSSRKHKLLRLDYDAVTAIIAVQPGAFAEPDQHRQVGLLPGVVFEYAMPAHAGHRGALRRIWKATRASPS
jgi:hypothetical protein